MSFLFFSFARNFLHLFFSVILSAFLILCPSSVFTQQEGVGLSFQSDVGVLDLRGKSPRFVSLVTANASSGKVVVLFRGDDAQLFNQVKTGTTQAINKGFQHLAGVVFADADTSFLQGKDCVQIYYDGVPTTGIYDATAPFIEDIVAGGVLESYARYHNTDE